MELNPFGTWDGLPGAAPWSFRQAGLFLLIPCYKSPSFKFKGGVCFRRIPRWRAPTDPNEADSLLRELFRGKARMRTLNHSRSSAGQPFLVIAIVAVSSSLPSCGSQDKDSVHRTWSLALHFCYLLLKLPSLSRKTANRFDFPCPECRAPRSGSPAQPQTSS